MSTRAVPFYCPYCGEAGFAMASDRPARVSEIRVTVRVPVGVPAERRAALRAVARHCTVHNTLISEPSIMIELE